MSGRNQSYAILKLPPTVGFSQAHFLSKPQAVQFRQYCIVVLELQLEHFIFCRRFKMTFETSGVSPEFLVKKFNRKMPVDVKNKQIFPIEISVLNVWKIIMMVSVDAEEN